MSSWRFRKAVLRPSSYYGIIVHPGNATLSVNELLLQSVELSRGIPSSRWKDPSTYAMYEAFGLCGSARRARQPNFLLSARRYVSVVMPVCRHRIQ